MRENKLLKKGQLQREEEKSALDKLADELKNGVFGVFYVLLKTNDTAIWRQLIFLIIEMLQLLSYTFDSSLGNVWKSTSIIKYLSQILNTFRVVYWLKQLTFDIYIIIFYVCIFLIFLIIIDFIYVAYSFKNRKFQFLWPIQVLKIACSLISTVLYIPILELFFSLSQCVTQVDTLLVLASFPSVLCFNSIHILHAAISYIIIIMFLLLNLLITKCFYESRLHRDPFAKMHSDCRVKTMVAKLLYVASFTFFNQEQYYWFLSIVLFLFSNFVMVSYVTYRPFFHDQAYKIVNVMNALFCWTSWVLLFSCIIKDLDFSGNLLIYLLGLPFVGMMAFNIKDQRKDQLLTNVNKFQNGEDIQKQIIYYLTIIENKDSNREALLTLKGYVNYHSEFCTLDDCPLKNFKKQLQKDQKKTYWQFGQTTTMYTALTQKNQVTSLESHPLLISQAKNLYINAIKRFPKCNGLKIDFAIFLLHKMHNKKEALRELINAEKQNPTYEQQFNIFRFRHIIEDELHEGVDMNAGGLDYVAAINFENHFNSFKQAIEKSSVLHYEFWNHLIDDNPDLARLSAQGTKINTSIQHVEDKWKKLGEMSTQTPKALRLYASFLIEILNDKELGNEQIIKAKEAAFVRATFDYGNLQEDATDMSSFSSDGTPCVYISGDQDRLGIITQCNMSVCRVFGFSKKEDLINHDVEILMPKIYSKYHKKFLESAIQKPPDLLSNKERPVFGKHFSGYIFPLWLQIKNLSSFLSGRQFVATFKIEKSYINKNVAHLILDKNKEVIDVSASCIAMLDIDLNKLFRKKAKFDIAVLLPTLFGANYYQFVNKAGCQIEYFYPELQDISKNQFGDQLQDNKNEQDILQDKRTPNIDNKDIEHFNGMKLLPDDDQKDDDNDEGHVSINQVNIGGFNKIEEDSKEDEEDYSDGDTTKRRGKKRKKQQQDGDCNEYDEDEDEDAEEAQNQVYEFKVIASSRSNNFQCNMNEIHFETQNIDNPNPGYFIRLESISEQALQKQLDMALKMNSKRPPQYQQFNSYDDGDNHEKNTQVQKIPKNIKQSTFQFSYDPIYKRFVRELRDKENKELLLDRNFLSLKKLKDTYKLQQLKAETTSPQKQISSKVAKMTYMNYLIRYQKWVEKGSVGAIVDENQSDHSSDHSVDDDDDVDETKQLKQQNDAPQNQTNLPTVTPQNNVGQFDLSSDYKKYIPGEGSGKEFLKQEIEKMIDILRKKHDIGRDVHLFRKLEGPKGQQSLQYEESQSQVASLFAQRNVDKMGQDSDDDDAMKDEESDKEKASKNEFRNSIKSRKAFSMAINDKAMPSSILRLSRTANFVLICLIALAVIDYSIVYQQIKDTILNFEVIENSYIMVAEIQKVCFNIRTLILLNEGILTNYQGHPNSTQLFTYINGDFQQSLKLLYTVGNSINLSKLKVSATHSDILNEKTINLNFRQDIGDMQILQFSLTQSILQIQSSIFTISNMDIKQFNNTNQDIFFILQNSFSDFYLAMIQSCNLYVSELYDRSSEKNEVCLILFVVSIFVLLLISIMITPVVQSVNKQKDKVLSLFCEIDDSNVRVLMLRCERFLSKLQQEDLHDEMESNEDSDMAGQKDEEDDYGLLSGQTKRVKRAKNMIKTQKTFYIKFFAAISIIEAYFSYNYSQERVFTNITHILGNELNISSAAEPYYWLILNTQREMYFNPNKLILHQSSFQVSVNAIEQMYYLNNMIQLTHISDISSLSPTFLNIYDSLVDNDTCPYVVDEMKGTALGGFQYFNSYDDCYAFISGSAEQGTSAVNVRYFETLKAMLSTYQEQIHQQGNINISKISYSILNSNDMFEAYLIQHEFTQLLNRMMTNSLKKTIVAEYEVMIQRRIFLLIFFLTIMLLSYVSIWLPLVSSLNNEIYKTKLMLMIIPLEILMRMKNVGKVLQSQSFIQEKGRPGSQPKSSNIKAPTIYYIM